MRYFQNQFEKPLTKLKEIIEYNRDDKQDLSQDIEKKSYKKWLFK
jgi:hypothetical protein